MLNFLETFRRKCRYITNTSTSDNHLKICLLSMFVMNRINVNKRSHLNFILNFSYLFLPPNTLTKIVSCQHKSMSEFSVISRSILWAKPLLIHSMVYRTELHQHRAIFPWNHRCHFHIPVYKKTRRLSCRCLPTSCKQHFIWHIYFILWPIQSLFGNKDTPFEKIAENLSCSFNVI